MNKKILVLLGVFALILCGCDQKIKEKEYENNHFKITMQEGFYEKDLAAATIYYESSNVLFTSIKESFEDLAIVGLDKDSTIDEYAKVVMANNKAEYDLQEKNDITYFTYEKEIQGKEFYYLTSIFKTNDAFWLISFGCESKNKEIYESNFIKWLNTISFK